MARYRIAVNMEFVRSADKSFTWGVAKAAELGYAYVEPMVHTGWELLSEVAYFHSFSMEEDPLGTATGNRGTGGDSGDGPPVAG